MFLKILKWTGIIIVIIIAGVSIATAMRQHVQFDAPYPDIKASNDSAVIAKGKHIVLGPGHCADCHSSIPNVDSLIKLNQEVPLSGGHEFTFDLGKFYARNLTSDKETGIGSMTDGEIARTLRFGVKKNGEAALPFMPFQNMSDEDLTAIVSYLRTLKPIKNNVPEHNYTLMGNLVKAFMLKPEGPTEPIKVGVPEDSTAEYGKHMVMAVANCNECHTKRDGIGRYIGKPLAGGWVMEGITVPNLTPHPESRIFDWTEEMFVKRFRMGRTNPKSHMPWEAFGRMSDLELKAIYRYLQTVEAAKTGEEMKN
jgi:mono/diheme cytochrome c family protein